MSNFYPQYNSSSSTSMTALLNAPLEVDTPDYSYQQFSQEQNLADILSLALTMPDSQVPACQKHCSQNLVALNPYLEAIGLANADTLIQSQTHAYLAILIKVNSLKSELQGTQKLYSTLLERLGTNPAPLLPGPPLESKAPPDRSNYPDVPFWTQSDYETHKQDQKSSGFTEHGSKCKDTAAPSLSLTFVTDARGTPVSQHTAMEMRACCRSIWTHLAAKGLVPTTWSNTALDAIDYYCQEMLAKYPDLGLADDHWKVDRIATQNYPAWIRTHGQLLEHGLPTEVKDEDNSSTDIKPSLPSLPIPVSVAKRSNECTESHVSHKKKKTTHKSDTPKAPLAPQPNDQVMLKPFDASSSSSDTMTLPELLSSMTLDTVTCLSTICADTTSSPLISSVQTPSLPPSSPLLSSPALTSPAHCSSLAVTVSLTTPELDSSMLTLPVISEPISDTSSDSPTIKTLYENQPPIKICKPLPAPLNSVRKAQPDPAVNSGILHDTSAVPEQAISPSAVPSPSPNTGIASTPPLDPAPVPCPSAVLPSSAVTHIEPVPNADPPSSCSTSPALFTVPTSTIPNPSNDQNSLLADNTVATDNPGSKAKFQPTKSSSPYNLFGIDYIVTHPGATRGTMRAAFESAQAMKKIYKTKSASLAKSNK
ncbi:hypothetical protein K439DRAFT_1624922 [Ramaria rubella]|nr:hypothetical protein K439DRAFT_1624922 [Ramaria rubella]